MQPFVKWVGGKREVIKKYLCNHIPKKFNKYYEPFVGGGSMLFFLEPASAVINDINKELITCYNVIKKYPKQFIKNMEIFKSKNNETDYYIIRDTEYDNEIDIASRFLYLNKTCFNGIYRVNSKGKFNVPYNGGNSTSFLDPENIINISNYFNDKKIEILNIDFEKVIQMTKKDDFLFCDPPYDYEIGSKGFDSYSKNGFGTEGQIRLSKSLKEADNRGVKWMLTNHDTKLIRDLYIDFKIINIKTNRFINSDANKRKNTGNEVIIKNYE